MPTRGPIFDGLPSPSLKKMEQMTSTELQGYLKTLEVERKRLAARLESRKDALSPDDERVGLEQRLKNLIEQGERILGSSPRSNR